MSDDIYRVVSPEARLVRSVVGPSAPLSDLGGKVIAQLWDYRFRGDLVFRTIEEELTARFPGLRFIGYETFGDTHGAADRRVLEDLPRKLALHGCDAVISAVGA